MYKEQKIRHVWSGTYDPLCQWTAKKIVYETIFVNSETEERNLLKLKGIWDHKTSFGGYRMDWLV